MGQRLTRLLRRLAGPDARFYTAGAIAFVVGVAVMLGPTLWLAWGPKATRPAAGGYRRTLPFIVAGQVLTTAAGLLLAIPATRRRRRRERSAAGCCPMCGYDLRATPEAGGALLSRCPECGFVAPPSPAKEAAA